MRKLSLMIATFLVFTVAAWAQGGSGGSGGGAAGSSGSAGSGAMGTSPDNQANPNSSTDKTHGGMHEKTMEGCIVQQGSDFFLATHNNSKFYRLQPQAGTDLSAHVGHKVKVHGTEEKAGAMGASTSADNTGGASATQSAGAASSSGSSNSVNTPQSTGNQSSSQSGTLPQSSANAGASGGVSSSGASASGSAGMGSSNITVDPSKVDKKEIMVSSVDMVSDSCGGSKKNDNNNPSTNPSKPY